MGDSASHHERLHSLQAAATRFSASGPSPAHSSTTASIMPGMAATLNNYFVPGYGISRAVIQGEIRYHCGPDAIVRPFTHQVRPPHVPCCCCLGVLTCCCQGRDGFLVTTAGPPLTKVSPPSPPARAPADCPQAQIEDIKEASREYEERQAERSGDDTEPFVNKPIPVGTRSGRKSF